MSNISADIKNDATVESLSSIEERQPQTVGEVVAHHKRLKHVLRLKQIVMFLALAAFLAQCTTGAMAQERGNDVIVPAGTLLRCTLNEPNFSSKTAEVGDPVICNLGSVALFGRSVFPRGAYLQGHLEADKEPGHFIGKGYLNLEFDHIGTPDGQLPLPTKVIAARGYKVDRKGDIVGHGHATRDTVEWMIPLLWPVKVLTLPDRGPRPTLKSEEELTLRLMDDLVVPGQEPQASGWRTFGKPSAQESSQAPNDARPSRYLPLPVPPPPVRLTDLHVAPRDPYSPRVTPRRGLQNVLIMRNGNTYIATDMRVEGNRLYYSLNDGTPAALPLEDIDWSRTLQANAENGTTSALNGVNGAR